MGDQNKLRGGGGSPKITKKINVFPPFILNLGVTTRKERGVRWLPGGAVRALWLSLSLCVEFYV